MIQLIINDKFEPINDSINLNNKTTDEIRQILDFFITKSKFYINKPLILDFHEKEISNKKQNILLKFAEDFQGDAQIIISSDTKIISTLLSRTILKREVSEVESDLLLRIKSVNNFVAYLKLVPIWKFLTDKSKQHLKEIL